MEHYSLLLRQDEHEDEFGADENDDYGLADQIRDLGMWIMINCVYCSNIHCLLGIENNDITKPEDILKYFNHIPVDVDYAPYPNKLVCQFHLAWVHCIWLDTSAYAARYSWQFTMPSPVKQSLANGILDSEGVWSSKCSVLWGIP